MHYKNGREAKNGDHVICKNYSGQIIGGVLFDLVAGIGPCNCSVGIIQPGGYYSLTCQDVNQMVHVEDALAAVDKNVRIPPCPWVGNSGDPCRLGAGHPGEHCDPGGVRWGDNLGFIPPSPPTVESVEKNYKAILTGYALQLGLPDTATVDNISFAIDGLKNAHAAPVVPPTTPLMS